MKVKLVFTIIIHILFVSCKKKENCEDKNIVGLIKSKDIHKVIEGNYLIGECKKENLVKYLFNNIRDSRITHNYEFYGISIYQSKVIALKKISGLAPPKEINNEVDESIIGFYFDWWQKQGNGEGNVPN